MVRSVPTELNKDHNRILEIAQVYICILHTNIHVYMYSYNTYVYTHEIHTYINNAYLLHTHTYETHTHLFSSNGSYRWQNFNVMLKSYQKYLQYVRLEAFNKKGHKYVMREYVRN